MVIARRQMVDRSGIMISLDIPKISVETGGLRSTS